jgi:hypothetical protein
MKHIAGIKAFGTLALAGFVMVCGALIAGALANGAFGS